MMQRDFPPLPFLLSHAAPVRLADDVLEAAPLAWVQRRGFVEVVEILQRHGAMR